MKDLDLDPSLQALQDDGLLGRLNDENVLLFVALERIGGVMVFDITDPTSPEFLTYFNDRDLLASTWTTPARSGPRASSSSPPTKARTASPC